MDLPQEILDYQERARRLASFDAGLDAILKGTLGRDWLLAKADDEERLLTPRQRDWRALRYYYVASIVNSGDLFGYLSTVYTRPEMFAEIGAVKTLAAAEELRDLHEAFSRLPTEEKKRAFWRETRAERSPMEKKAEGLCEFADLLIRFAERYPDEFPETKALNPFDRIAELMGSLQREAEETGLDSRKLDIAAGLLDSLRNLTSDPENKNQ